MKLMLNVGVENARILSEKLDSGDPVGSPQSPGESGPMEQKPNRRLFEKHRIVCMLHAYIFPPF
jgi:hypothetical protein